MALRPRTYSPLATEAAKLLGARIRLARRERRWTVEDLAERVGVSHVTITKIEHGDPGVRLGTAFEAAATVGVPLFHPDRSPRTLDADMITDRLAVLPELVRKPAEVDDDF